MITYNFYKFQLTDNYYRFNSLSNVNISSIIKNLEKEFKEVNFIKFYVGWGDLIFLADRDLSDYIKLNIISTTSDSRPKYNNGALLRIKKMYPNQIKNWFKNPKYTYNGGLISYYKFGPNPKIFEKEFTINALGSIAEALILNNN